MDQDEKRKLLEQGYGCYHAQANGIHSANVTAIIDRLVSHYAVESAFHQGRKEIWIKFKDHGDLYGNRNALEYAFNVSTF